MLSLGLLAAWTADPHEVHGGGGPENVFLVVNSAVSDSMVIANHFVDRRKVPRGSIFYVDWPDPPFETEMQTFRDRVLAPTLDEIKKRQLSSQIDYIVYSSGFPYAVNFSADVGETRVPHPKASITGATFLHEFTMLKSKQLMGARANAYARNTLPGSDGASHGFRARYGIDLMGNRVKEGDSGQRYYLSMMLGFTRGVQNTTLTEVLNYLNSGVKADGTEPKGTIYFVKNDNIRSSKRHDHFPRVVAELKKLGVNAEIIEGGTTEKLSLPVDKKDVQGAVVGFYKMVWGSTNSEIRPGAIIENFTSYGGVLSGQYAKIQSMLTLFLKHGAIASSGTVCEPFAFLEKFPHPLIQLHYARGCSVAEAFYQSVLSPYQLLIVGDPLCAPWAVPPEVTVRGLETTKAVTGTIEFQVEAESRKGHRIRNFEVFIDGILAQRRLPGQPVRIDTNGLLNGYHELRVVAVEDTPIETQGRTITGFVSMNLPEPETGENAPPQLAGVSAQLVPANLILRRGQPGFIQVHSPGAREIRIYHGRTQVGSIKAESGQIPIDPTELGGGLVTLRPLALPKDRTLKPVYGFPMKIRIEI